MNAILATLTGALLGLAWLLATMQPPAPVLVAPSVPVAAPEQAQTPREQWAVDLLARLGNTQPSADTVAFVLAWMQGEDGLASEALSRHNPLNTTQGAPGAWVINSHGVKGYPDYETGMRATIGTLTNGYYPRTLYGLQVNAPVADDGELGTWGTGAGNVRALWGRAAAVQGASDTQSYVLAGDIGVNVRAALNANGGALQSFTIQPGETWSFGRSIAPISAMGMLPVVCGPAGCSVGGGWCDLAAMYVRVADQLGLQSTFPAHAGVGDTRMPGILLDEWGAGGDLQITNTTARAITFGSVEQDGALVVWGEQR
jgi:hypothetical protein